MKMPATVAVVTMLAMTGTLAAGPAFAWGLGLHPDGWYQVTRGGWTYWMPPTVCTHGPFPRIYDGKPRYRPYTWMKKHFGKGKLGMLKIDSYGMHIYVAAGDVPAVVTRDNLIHEEAEARGCGDDPYDRKYSQRG